MTILGNVQEAHNPVAPTNHSSENALARAVLRCDWLNLVSGHMVHISENTNKTPQILGRLVGTAETAR